MKIFFDASLTGKREFGDTYKKIAELLTEGGHKLIESTLFRRTSADVAAESSDEAGQWYSNLRKWVGDADIAVFEVSFPSTGIGHEVSLALHAGKPVVALHVSGRVPHVLESIPSDRLQVVEYEDGSLKSVLASAIQYASEQMDTRFNFFISPKIANYLDWIAKNKKIPRAVFLRRLIEEDMKKIEAEEAEK